MVVNEERLLLIVRIYNLGSRVSDLPAGPNAVRRAGHDTATIRACTGFRRLLVDAGEVPRPSCQGCIPLLGLCIEIVPTGNRDVGSGAQLPS
jgi:hypothetical protein